MKQSSPSVSGHGPAVCRAVFLLGIVYVATTAIGLLNLESRDAPIGDPFFTIMEVLILLIAPLMVTALAMLHSKVTPEKRIYSALAFAFMVATATITSGVHFVILLLGQQPGLLMQYSFLLSFKWPSAAYALDILAWDWFYALSMICAALSLGSGQKEGLPKMLLAASGILSLIGLVGLLPGYFEIRGVAIAGYAAVGPLAFLSLAKILRGRH